MRGSLPLYNTLLQKFDDLSKFNNLFIFINQDCLIMNQGKIVAIVTGVISVLIAIAYLVLVQLIDFRGEMIPAPVDDFSIITLNISW